MCRQEWEVQRCSRPTHIHAQLCKQRLKEHAVRGAGTARRRRHGPKRPALGRCLCAGLYVRRGGPADTTQQSRAHKRAPQLTFLMARLACRTPAAAFRWQAGGAVRPYRVHAATCCPPPSKRPHRPGCDGWGRPCELRALLGRQAHAQGPQGRHGAACLPSRMLSHAQEGPLRMGPA